MLNLGNFNRSEQLNDVTHLSSTFRGNVAFVTRAMRNRYFRYRNDTIRNRSDRNDTKLWWLEIYSRRSNTTFAEILPNRESFGEILSRSNFVSCRLSSENIRLEKLSQRLKDESPSLFLPLSLSLCS